MKNVIETCGPLDTQDKLNKAAKAIVNAAEALGVGTGKGAELATKFKGVVNMAKTEALLQGLHKVAAKELACHADIRIGLAGMQEPRHQ